MLEAGFKKLQEIRIFSSYDISLEFIELCKNNTQLESIVTERIIVDIVFLEIRYK